MLLEWNLKKIRLKEQKKLNETNWHLYKSITTYIQNSNLSEVEKEEALQQVMDMMLQAQMENKSVNLFIGEDYEEFCKSIIEEYNCGKSKIYKGLNYIQKYLIWMILISAFMEIFEGIISSSFSLGITVDLFIIANVISLIIIPASKKERQETASMPLFIRLFVINRNLDAVGFYAIALVLAIIGLLRFILGKNFGHYTINLYANISYVILILLIIGIIELYKRVQDNLKDIK